MLLTRVRRSPQVFTSRYRAKFLQLADVFLASSLVPAYTVAAFVKRFARISVTAPPMGAVVCTAFVHNLLRRHPSCTCMLHRPGAEGAEGAGADPYDDAAADPAESRAVESSLWELDALRRHLHPMVRSTSRMCLGVRDLAHLALLRARVVSTRAKPCSPCMQIASFCAFGMQC